MTNLELMEKATSFTMGAYMNTYYKNVENGSMDYNTLERNAVSYSGSALMNVLYSSDGMCTDYTRKDNLRYDMAALGGDAIKNELLKNIVNVATYQILNHTRAGLALGQEVKPGMYEELLAVTVFNAMSHEGVEQGYQLLSDPNVLSSACNLFAGYRREGKKEVLDSLAQTNQAAVYLNNELDIYYARYGDRPKERRGDTTVLNGDAPSGYGGK